MQIFLLHLAIREFAFCQRARGESALLIVPSYEAYSPLDLFWNAKTGTLLTLKPRDIIQCCTIITVREDNVVFKRIISKMTAAAMSVGLYFPIIAGILSRMVWILIGWYVSWEVLGYIIPYSNSWSGLLYMFDPSIPEELQIGMAVAFRFLQVLIFCFGLFLLCYGLIVLAKARLDKEGLVKHGPYSWVRHPQHLGILLMLSLFAFPLRTSYSRLFFPVTRPGDLVSMCSILFLLVLVADLEDYWLAKQYGDSYIQYQQNTPFILPVRAKLPALLQFKALARGRPLRYIAIILSFWVFLILLSYCFRHVQLFVR